MDNPIRKTFFASFFFIIKLEIDPIGKICHPFDKCFITAMFYILNVFKEKKKLQLIFGVFRSPWARETLIGRSEGSRM